MKKILLLELCIASLEAQKASGLVVSTVHVEDGIRNADKTHMVTSNMLHSIFCDESGAWTLSRRDIQDILSDVQVRRSKSQAEFYARRILEARKEQVQAARAEEHEATARQRAHASRRTRSSES